MKKFTALVSIITALSLVGGGFLNLHSEAKSVEATSDPTSGTVTTNFKKTYDESTATAESNYKYFNEPDTVPLYINGNETALFTASVTKGGSTEKVKIRNYNGANVNYYLFLKYSSAKTAGSLGAEIMFEASGSYVFESLYCSYIDRGPNQIGIYYSLNGTDWTKTSYSETTAHVAIDFTLPVAAPYVKIAHYYVSSDFIGLKDISLSFASSSSKRVTFDSQGGTDVASQYVESGGYAVAPDEPTRPREGTNKYTFAGWYTDPENGDLFDFVNTPVTDNLTLYAHWDVEVVTTYTLTFDTQGGSEVEPEVVPADGETKFSKPTAPTYPSDSKYNYSFHNWYTTPDCKTKFNFDAIPDDDVTAYAGWGKSSFAPDDYTTINPARNIATWGEELSSGYQALDIETKDTVGASSSLPNMHWIVTPNGSSNSGMKHHISGTNHYFYLNDATVSMTILDQTKYFKGFRLELYVTTYSDSVIVPASLSTNGVICDSGVAPHDSLSNSSLALDGDCSSKPQEFTLNVGNLGGNGTRFRYLYAEFGTYTAEEMGIKYATKFNDANVCGTTPTSGLDEGKWSAQATAYASLTEETKTLLTSYDGSDSEILEFLERYDRVIELHGEDYDYMGRVAAGQISLSTTMTLFKSVAGNNSNAIIIVVGFIIIGSACVVPFFVRKRKENE